MSFFKWLKTQSEPHSISVVRSRVGLYLKDDNPSIWLGSHYTRRKIYQLWLENCGWIAKSDSNGSYGSTSK